jgi:hypothetical protein
LILGPQSQKDVSSGNLVNLMQVNTQILVDLIPLLNMVWSSPFQLAISVLLLWKHLKYASFSCIAVIVLFIPINSFITNKLRKYQSQKFKIQDTRIKFTNEILSGIKV